MWSSTTRVDRTNATVPGETARGIDSPGRMAVPWTDVIQESHRPASRPSSSRTLSSVSTPPSSRQCRGDVPDAERFRKGASTLRHSSPTQVASGTALATAVVMPSRGARSMGRRVAPLSPLHAGSCATGSPIPTSCPPRAALPDVGPALQRSSCSASDATGRIDARSALHVPCIRKLVGLFPIAVPWLSAGFPAWPAATLNETAQSGHANDRFLSLLEDAAQRPLSKLTRGLASGARLSLNAPSWFRVDNLCRETPEAWTLCALAVRPGCRARGEGDGHILQTFGVMADLHATDRRLPPSRSASSFVWVIDAILTSIYSNDISWGGLAQWLHHSTILRKMARSRLRTPGAFRRPRSRYDGPALQ